MNTCYYCQKDAECDVCIPCDEYVCCDCHKHRCQEVDTCFECDTEVPVYGGYTCFDCDYYVCASCVNDADIEGDRLPLHGGSLLRRCCAKMISLELISKDDYNSGESTFTIIAKDDTMLVKRLTKYLHKNREEDDEWTENFNPKEWATKIVNERNECPELISVYKTNFKTVVISL